MSDDSTTFSTTFFFVSAIEIPKLKYATNYALWQSKALTKPAGVVKSSVTNKVRCVNLNLDIQAD